MSNSSDIKTVHYLGSKMRLLDEIKDAVDSVDNKNGKVCDLFCGSAVVSEFMLQYRDVVAVDIQQYSKIFCEAGLTGLETTVNSDYVLEEIKNSIERKNNLRLFDKLILYEKKCLKDASEEHIDGLYEIIQKGSLYAFFNKLQYADGKLSEELKAVFSDTEEALKKDGSIDSADSTILRYYGGLYFSYMQAIDIDAIASYAFEQTGSLRSKILAALMGAATDVVDTVGKQFAQPLKVISKDGTPKETLLKKILNDRSMDVFEHFKTWFEYYLNRPEPKHKFKILCEDYIEALEQLANDDLSVIYADPPYTRYHYSRYYHILETICLHDNPIISTTFPNGKGGLSRAMYRNDRYQSPFCIKKQAPGAFEKLFKYSRLTGAGLVLSYSPYDKSSGATPRMLSIEQLVDMGKKYYKDAEVVSPGKFMHSRFNSVKNNYNINYEAEKLIIYRV